MQIDIDYYKGPDEAFYALVFIYNFDVVATKAY